MWKEKTACVQTPHCPPPCTHGCRPCPLPLI
jgi:hypothetical protein